MRWFRRRKHSVECDVHWGRGCTCGPPMLIVMVDPAVSAISDSSGSPFQAPTAMDEVRLAEYLAATYSRFNGSTAEALAFVRAPRQATGSGRTVDGRTQQPT